MVSNKQIEDLLLSSNDVKHAEVSGDGYHYKLIIVSDAFVNMPKVARQRWVYTLLNKQIISGSLHALSMQTYTIDEWEKKLG